MNTTEKARVQKCRQAAQYIEKYSKEHKVFKRVPEDSWETNLFVGYDTATIIDLETTGLDSKTCEIIELGLIQFAYDKNYNIVGIQQVYNELNDPGKDIPDFITKITGITTDQVKDKFIDWRFVNSVIESSQIVICHNAAFDRKFLERQAHEETKELALNKQFGCTKNDINWKERGFANCKLDYLNWAMSYFYDAHRAINDCWATLNLLSQNEGAFEELMNKATTSTYIIDVIGNTYNVKDGLKELGFKWNPSIKGWSINIDDDEFKDITDFKVSLIHGMMISPGQISINKIDSIKRYSIKEKAE